MRLHCSWVWNGMACSIVKRVWKEICLDSCVHTAVYVQCEGSCYMYSAACMSNIADIDCAAGLAYATSRCPLTVRA